MKRWYLFVLALAPIALCACQGPRANALGEGVALIHGLPGYWFHLVFIVLPLVLVLVKLFREFREVSESLITLEGQVRRILSRLEDLEKNAEAPRAKKPAAKSKK